MKINIEEKKKKKRIFLLLSFRISNICSGFEALDLKKKSCGGHVISTK